MAFANEVKPFGHDIKFRVGERVRIIIRDIDPKEINIDTGIITKIYVHHLHSPKLRKVYCSVWMDGEYFKTPLFKGLGQQCSTEIHNIEKLTN